MVNGSIPADRLSHVFFILYSLVPVSSRKQLLPHHDLKNENVHAGEQRKQLMTPKTEIYGRVRESGANSPVKYESSLSQVSSIK